jgi:hypothetical protein
MLIQFHFANILLIANAALIINTLMHPFKVLVQSPCVPKLLRTSGTLHRSIVGVTAKIRKILMTGFRTITRLLTSSNAVPCHVA